MNNNSDQPIFNSEGQKQIEQYAQAFDSLRNSISSLNRPLNDISKGITSLNNDISKFTDNVKNLNIQNQELSNSGNKIKESVKDLSDNFEIWAKVLKFVKAGVVSLEDALTGGLAVLTVFGPAILTWVGDMLKGNTTLTALAKTLKDTKTVMDAVNQTMLQGTQNAQPELAHLKLLYNATQNHNLSLKERKKAVDEIRSQYPSYFKNISDENIINGKAIKQYNDLANAIIDSSKARAAENIMAKNQGRQVGNNDRLVGLKANLKQYNDQLKTAQANYNSIINNPPVINNNSFAPGSDTREEDAYSKLAKIRDQRNATKKIVDDINTDSKLLDLQNQALVKKISDYTEKYGVKILTNLKTIESGKKEFVTKTVKPDDSAATEKAYQDSLIKQLQDTANGLAKKVELQHNGYAEEQATLKHLYDNKLISQEQYQQESTQLEEKYHVGIGEIMKRMNAEDLEKVEKQQKDLVEARQQKELLTKDQHDVDKAILPWNKLEAEKKLITDKYNFEIQKAAEAGKDTAALRLQYQEEITAATKKSEEQRKQMAIQAAQQLSNTAFSIIGNSIKSASEAKIKALENDKAKELSNTNLTKTQKALIEAKYKKKENDEKIKAFKAEQKLQIAQAVINGALSVTKTLSTTGLPVAIPLIAADVAMTAIQIAKIASEKPPAFAKGGRFISDGRGALLPGYSRTDNTNAYLRSGEAIVVSEAMRNPWARNLVSAINVAHGGRDFSAPNPGKGYAIGGIFTDGGNANRYYNQPVNDIKEMANTVAYQMINNFPPIYVDVKDVNNQQNILAQTVDRVNL